MRRFQLLWFALSLAAVCLGGCQKNESQVSISVVGSSSVEPLMTILTDIYHEQHSDIDFDIQATGSSAGIKAALSGATDIAMSSRTLTADEQADHVEDVSIALDGIAIVVHPDNPVENLTQTQIRDIFNGSIDNWNEVGGADRPIVLVSREAGSGTRNAFEEMLGLLVDHYSMLAEDSAIYCDSTNSIAQNVADKTNAIGYVSLGSLGHGVKALRVDDIVCSEESIEDGSYPLARPFTLLINRSDTNEHTGAIESFLAFVESDEAQRAILSEGFVPMQVAE